MIQPFMLSDLLRERRARGTHVEVAYLRHHLETGSDEVAVIAFSKLRRIHKQLRGPVSLAWLRWILDNSHAHIIP
jgi:hypothetical protein